MGPHLAEESGSGLCNAGRGRCAGLVCCRGSGFSHCFSELPYACGCGCPGTVNDAEFICCLDKLNHFLQLLLRIRLVACRDDSYYARGLAADGSAEAEKIDPPY